jgi:hypothetical protein
MEVTPDHSWPQAKACSRASLEGSQALNQRCPQRDVSAPGWQPRHRDSYATAALPARLPVKVSASVRKFPGTWQQCFLAAADWQA